nr:hypothetical protein [Tanacetum cinerariifolium]
TVEDKILVPKPHKNCARCTRCGYLVDGPNCQGCALLRQELEENLVTYSPDLQNTSEPSNASTNIFNAPREPYVVKQDNGSFVDKIIFDLNRAPDSPDQFHCFHCKDVLRYREACKRCTYAKCGSGLGKGLCYICGHNQNSLNDSPSISKTSSQSPPNINHCCYECEPYNNQTIDELPQTLPIFYPTFHSEDESPFTLDSTPTYVDESPNVFNPPPQPSVYPCEFYGNDAYYGHYCIPQAPFIYLEQCYNQDFNFSQDFQDVPQQYPCCDDCGVTHDTYQCQPMNEVYYYGQNSCYDSTSIGFDQSQPQQYTLLICFDDDDEDYTSAITPDEPVLSTEGIPEHMCDVPFLDNSPPLDVSKDQIQDFSESNEEFSSTDDDSFSFDKIDYVEASPPDFELVSSEGDMLLFEAFLNDDHSSDLKTKSSSTSLNSLLEETNNFHNSLPEFTTFLNVLCDAKCESDSSDDQSCSDEDVLEKIVSKPLSEEEIIPMKSLRTHDSSLLISSKIDSLLDEFTGELTLLKSIPPGIDETDCDFEEDIRLIEKLFDSLMEEIDLFCTLDYPMPPGIGDKDYDSERDILIHKDLPSNNTLSFAEKESVHFDISLFSRPSANHQMEKSPDLLSHRLKKTKKRTKSDQTGQKREAGRSRKKFKAVTVDSGRKTEQNAKRMAGNAYTVKVHSKFKRRKKRKGSKLQFHERLKCVKVWEACKRCTCAKCGSGLGKGLCYICGHNQNSLNDSPSISETSSQSPPNINHCCYECGDPLDSIFCKRCTCKSCGKDAHIGYNCPSKVLVISNPKPCNNQTIDELPQTLPFFHPTFHSEAESPFNLDSTPTYVDESPNIFNPPPQSFVYPCEFCGNDAYYGHYCTPQAPFIYPEPCYNQDFNFSQDFQNVPQQYPCCDDCEQYTVDHPIFNAHNSYLDSQIQLNSTLAKIKDQMTSITSLCEMACQVVQKKLEEKQLEEERAAKAKYWKLRVCYDGEERSDSLDDNIISGLPPFSAITLDEPVLSTEEPDNSLSMGDEHLDTILATESDEFIKSGVEDLIPIPSESEGIPEHMFDVPSHDNSPPLDVSNDQIEDFSESNEEFSSIDDDSFSIDDIDYVEASPPDSELVSLEVMEIVIPEVGGIDDDILLTIKHDDLHEKLRNVNLLISKIKVLNANPTSSSDCKTKSSSTSLNSLLEETNTFDNSLPKFKTFCFDVEEISSSKYEVFHDDHVKEISSGSPTT